MATVTTTGAGDWNTAGNWDLRVPLVGDDAVVNHAMTVDGTGATFNTADINAVVTCTANQTWTIADGGSIDHTGGEIDIDDNDVDLTMTASVGASNWTWQIDAGTVDNGDGVLTFEYATITVSGTAIPGFNTAKGTVKIGEDCTFTSTSPADIFTCNNFEITAGKTLTLGNGTDVFYIEVLGDSNIIGTSGNEVIIDGNGGKGYIRLTGGTASSKTIQYMNVSDAQYGLLFKNINTGAGDSVTLDNCTATSCAVNGFSINACVGAITATSCTASANTLVGFSGDNVPGVITITYNMCNAYSNGSDGFFCNNGDQTLILNRCKGYSNTGAGANVIDGVPITVDASLFYENSTNGIVINNDTGHTVTNVTSVDNTLTNIFTSMDGANTCDIKNTICSGGTKGIDSDGTNDPTVTYCNVEGASTANYEGMADPTGTNGNISVDPKFTDSSSDDYSITGRSLCANAGDNTGAPTVDINGDSWLNTNVEIGAFTVLQTFMKGGSMIGCGVSGIITAR